jgi:hypothetical protein
MGCFVGQNPARFSNSHSIAGDEEHGEGVAVGCRVAEPVRARRLTQDEDRKLQQLVPQRQA